MKKRFLPVPLLLLIPALLLVAVIAAGSYRLSLDDEDIASKQGRHVQKAEGGEVMKMLFSITDAKPWQVAIPETMVSATLTRLSDMKGDNPRAEGDYVNEPERGSVSLDYTQLVVLYFEELPASQMLFAAPYTVSNQGSGLFTYLGLFRLDHDAKKITQLDYHFIGDRIAGLSLSIDHPFDVSHSLVAEFKTHKDNQAMAEEPAQQNRLVIEVTPEKFQSDK